MDFIREFEGRFGDTFWELLAVTGSLLGVLGLAHGTSRSGQILCDRPSVRPYEIFFRADFGSRKWNSSRRNEKKDVRKSDIALIT